jgi:GxxExxY protein
MERSKLNIYHKDSKTQSDYNYSPLSDFEEELAGKIVNAAYNVHSKLGPGLIERIYETCFCYELSKSGLKFKRQVSLPINYDSITLESGLKLDVLVEDKIICELKAVESMLPVFDAQLLTYMKLAKKRPGFLINFNVPLIKNGMKRKIIDFESSSLRGE